jgi:pilus assembly protein Flp/PilA
MQLFKNFLRNESGATAIEYGLIAGLISVVIIVAVTLVGTTSTDTFDAVASALSPRVNLAVTVSATSLDSGGAEPLRLPSLEEFILLHQAGYRESS